MSRLPPGFLSESVLRMKPSATLQIAQLARDLKAQGRDIISLSTGEPDFKTPAHIIEAADRAARDGKTKYPPSLGVNELREAISAKLRRENGVSVGIDCITVTHGAKQAISNALISTIDPGDEAIIPAPYWVSYPELVTLLGGRPVIAPTRAPRFTLAPEDLEAAITPRTKWLLLNSPNNPSGATYTPAELRALGAVLAHHPHVLVMSDDIYEYLVYDGVRFTTFMQAVPEMADRTLLVNGVSKAFAMTGWRIGYAAGPADLVKAMSKVLGQVSSGANMVGQWAAATALDGPRDDVERFVATYAERRRFARGVLNACRGLSCPLPDGAFYLFPDCTGAFGRRTRGGVVIDDDAAFARELLAAEGVAVVPGSAFGTPGRFRITFAIATDALTEACRRIERFCGALE